MVYSARGASSYDSNFSKTKENYCRSQFLHIKKHLARKKFDDDDEVQEEVMTWFKGQAADFYDSGIQKLVPRLNKCLDNAGDCVDK